MQKQVARLDRWRSGYAFALTQPADTLDPADVVGTLRCPGDAPAIHALALRALTAPAGSAAGDDEIATLARHPLARWHTRRQPSESL